MSHSNESVLNTKRTIRYRLPTSKLVLKKQPTQNYRGYLQLTKNLTDLINLGKWYIINTIILMRNILLSKETTHKTFIYSNL